MYTTSATSRNGLTQAIFFLSFLFFFFGGGGGADFSETFDGLSLKDH